MEEREWGRGDRKDLQDLRIAMAELSVQVKENARSNQMAFENVNAALEGISRRLFGDGNSGELETMKERIARLESARDKMLGMAAAITVISTVLATIIQFVMASWMGK